ALGGEREALATGAGHFDFDVLARLEVRETADGELVIAGEGRRAARVAAGALQRKHAHADQVRAVDALEALDDHRPYAEQVGPLGRPVAARAGAVFLAGNDDERRAVFLVLHRRVVDRHGLAAVLRHPAFDAR